MILANVLAIWWLSKQNVGKLTILWRNETFACQIFNWEMFNVSEFELRIFQHIRFWISNLKRFRLWNQKFTRSYFEVKILEQFRFWAKICIQKRTLWISLIREKDIFWIFCALLECMILKQIFYNASDFEMVLLNNVPDFGLKS